MFCEQCGNELYENAKFCNKCGTQVEGETAELVCASCGTYLNEGDIFCFNCGVNKTTSIKTLDKKTKFDVILKDFNETMKIALIKEIRNVFNLGLKEAKELVEGAPILILEAVSKEEAEKVNYVLTSAGGIIEIQ